MIAAYRDGVITAWMRRLRQWEKRVHGWVTRHVPERRRWTLLVLVPAVVLCCCGVSLGVPVAWLLRSATDAGRGAATPDAAVNDYLMALGYGNEEGLLPVLDDERQGELLTQWRAYRDAMQGTDPPPLRLDFGALSVGPVAGHRAKVTAADVQAVWWSSSSGRIGGYNSEALVWRFETRDDDGWRVSAVEAPAWCGGYVLASRCRTQ